jgi:hypothetical protein
MSHALISRSPDLKRLRDEGYAVEIRSAYLLVHHVPYLNAAKEIQYGTLAAALTLAGDVTARPETHVALFTGNHPCHRDGTEITQIKHQPSTETLGKGLVATHSFSNKPPNGYADYYEKMTRYISIISAPAQALNPDVKAQTFLVIPAVDDYSVFQYLDTASSRAGILGLAEKLRPYRLAIVGLGGTGSYVLDFAAKTPAQEIHLFDGDVLLSHNAFRSPGAVALATLVDRPMKVAYYAELYAQVRRKIVPHPYDITSANVAELRGFDFVFVCLDKGSPKQVIIPCLEDAGIAFLDVGMGVELANDALVGVLRVTTSTKQTPLLMVPTTSTRRTFKSLSSTHSMPRWQSLSGRSLRASTMTTNTSTTAPTP